MGDFNAKVCQPKPEEHLIMNNHGYGTKNRRDERVIGYANEHKLSINTFFEKPKDGHKCLLMAQLKTNAIIY